MIQVGGKRLSLEDFSAILYKKETIQPDPKRHLKKWKPVTSSFEEFSGQKLIYGINTGFGPMAQYKVSQENILQLQYNLIRSHSSGSGNLMPPLLVKAVMVARLNSLMQGYSGVHTDLVNLLDRNDQ